MKELTTAEDVLGMLCDVSKLETRHVRIHPDAARALLEINTLNRTMTSARVDDLARALREGRWQLINNGIAVSTGGDLVDGQHRLTAVVIANVPAEFWLITGQDEATRTVIDVGKARTLADTLTIAGYGRGQTSSAAAVSLLYRYENDLLATMGNSRIPNDVLLEFVKTLDMERMRHSVNEAQTCQAPVPQFNRSALAALFYLAYSIDVFEAAAFIERLKTGANLSSGDPELTLRNSVGRLDHTKRNTWHFCLYAKAWNARRLGKSINVLRFTDSEKIPVVR